MFNPKTLMLPLMAATLIVALVAIAHAQDDSNPKRGFYPAGSYAVSDIETINTASGNLILNIPIASLPAGRSGAKGPGFSVTYNSKLWDVETNFIPGDPQTGGSITFHDLTPSPLGGWRYNLPVYTLLSGEFVPSGTNCNGGYVHKLSVVFPDGGIHEFYPAGFTIKNSSGGNKYSQIRLDGWKATAVQTSGDCILNHSLQTSSTMTYFSIDGTYLRLDIQHDNDQDPGNNPWTLYFPDGQRVESSLSSDNFPDYQRTYDRNNNYTEFQRFHNYNGQTNRTADKLSDEFGRYILIDYGDPGVLNPTTTITTPGVNNEELRWTISWINPSQDPVNKSYCDHFATGGACDSFNNLNEILAGIDQITLPIQAGGLAYHFSYNGSSGGWGELSSLTLPTGAVSNYHYEQDGQNQIAWHKVKDNAVAHKDLSYQLEYDLTSTPTTDSWFYSYNHTTTTTTITAPDNGVTTVYHFSGSTTLLGDSAKESVYKTVRPDGSIEENLWRINTPAGIVEFSNQAIKVNPFIKAKFVTITNSLGQPVKTAVKDYSYDKNGNVTAVAEYDWIDYSSIQRDADGQPLDVTQQPALTTALLKRLTINSYVNPTPDASDTTTISNNAYSRPSSPTLRSLLAGTQTGTASQVQARSEYAYDTGGNVTQTSRWDSTKGGYTNPLTPANSLLTSNQYVAWVSGATGKLTSTTDARGVQTRFTYGTVGAFTDLYPTTIESAYNTPVQHSETREYDFNSGVVTKVTDDNSISTKTVYDAMGRTILVQEAFGSVDERQTATQYFDSERRVVLRSDLTANADAKLVTVQHYDQLGRIRLTRELEDSSVSQAETSETIGIKVQTRYLATSGSSYVLSSNPYRSTTSQNGTETTMGWTRTKSDVAGRVVEVQTFGGNGLPAPWANNTASTGTVSTSYNADLITVTDQAQKLRRSKVDALGRLVRVDEPVSVSGTDQLDDSSGNPRQATDYAYDALGNLRTVTQGSQASRIFDYSSLSRLISAQNPENGFVSYKYDENGNLKVKADARTVSAHYKYDQLNRIIKRWYNSSSAVEEDPSNENLPAGVSVSPQANFFYDAHPATSPFIGFQNVDKSKGRLTAVTYGAGSTEGDYYRYDLFGRNFSKTQRIGAKDYNVTAQYNRANTITLLTYPSTFTVANTLDTSGRLSAMSGNLGNNQKTYTTGVLYSANGALTKEQFGTTKAIYDELFYNSRLQLAEIWARTTDSVAPNRGKILNQYSLQCSGVSCNATDNNGNLRRQDLYIPGDDQDQASTRTTWYQQYDYDELNRLQRVHEYIPANPSKEWQQEFVYDRWGNRTIHQTNTFGTSIPKPNYQVSTANNNRLSAPSGYVLAYDDAGNVKTDTYSGTGDRSYDAENRMTQWGDPNGQYTYDGNGRRVRRKVSNVETWQIYGIGGELLAEYPANGSQDSPSKEYGYRNGQLLISAESGNSSAPPVFADDFNDNSLNPNNWTLWFQGAPTVSEQSQQLQISLTPNTAGYNGVYSTQRYDLTNRMVEVESVQAVSQAGWCENFMELELDANNYFMIQVGAGNMIFRSRVNGVNDQTSIPFDGTANRFWRIRHDQTANLIYFETKASNSVWLTRKTVTPGFSLTSLRFHLLAGAYGTGNSTPGTAKYDNFKLLASNADSTSLNVSNSGFEAPVIGTGNFQYAPTGGSWTFANGGGISGMNSGFTGTPSAAPEGVQVAFIQATGTVQQSISGFQANTNYVITFKSIQRTNCCNTGGQDIGVYVDSTQVATFHPSAIAYTEYSTPAFVTTSGSHTVKFAGLNPLGGDHTAFIDNVQITGSPKPGFGIQWLLADQLATTRMIFDESGALANVKRHDYLPFGEELTGGTNLSPSPGIRKPALGYGCDPSDANCFGDAVRQKLTSKERDVETGLDYFVARYYSSSQGRFTGVDAAGPDPTRPQTLNRYQYCLNNPLRYIDPDGRYEEDVHRDLTFAIALAAGFNTGSAKAIAKYDQWADDNPATSPMGMTPFGDDVRKRELYHFTTPERRDEMWQTFTSSGSLADLGTYEHALQDSFSHNGYSARIGQVFVGSWPDKTYNQPKLADQMAWNTLDSLKKGLSVRQSDGREPVSYKAVEWKDIKRLVMNFNRARTIEDKKRIVNQLVAYVQEKHYQQELDRQAREMKKRLKEKYSR
jgi:RHS repeat-associated protein